MFDFFIMILSFIPLWIWLLLVVLILGKITWTMWVHYIRQDFISGIDFVLLEIIPPRDVLRSPKAMELFFTNALYHWSLKGGREEYWQGAVWFWFSLEIASIDGQVHFYIRTPTRLRELIETQMYAQYPQAQVREALDYTLAVPEISENGKWNGWGCEFMLEKPEAYPIKTYVDYGLDKDPKEEYKIDPISPIIELFGSLKKGEQMWMQIIVTPSKKEYRTDGVPWYKSHAKKYHNWVRECQIQLDKVIAPYARLNPRPDGTYAKEIRAPGFLDPIIKGISAKMTKIGFDTGVRIYYTAKKEAWQMNNRRNIRLILRQYSNPYLNSFYRINSTQADALGGGGFLGSFLLLSPEKVIVLANRMLHEYRERSFFHLPMRHHIISKLPWPISPYIFPKYFHPHTFVLNVEELATLWHFPGQILKVPTLERIESKEASPPTNLPI